MSKPLLARIAGRKTTIEEITAPLQGIVDNLDAFILDKQRESGELYDKIADLQAQRKSAQNEASFASATRQNVAQLLGLN